jgi:hypothetical protein
MIDSTDLIYGKPAKQLSLLAASKEKKRRKENVRSWYIQSGAPWIIRLAGTMGGRPLVRQRGASIMLVLETDSMLRNLAYGAAMVLGWFGGDGETRWWSWCRVITSTLIRRGGRKTRRKRRRRSRKTEQEKEEEEEEEEEEKDEEEAEEEKRVRGRVKEEEEKRRKRKTRQNARTSLRDDVWLGDKQQK